MSGDAEIDPCEENGNPELLARYGFNDFELVRTFREKTLFVMACYKFVKNFKPEQQLKVLPSGAVRLENVELETSLLWNDSLPGSLKFARLGVLQFDVSLFQDPSQEPTRIAIRDAYLLVVAGDQGAAGGSVATSDESSDAPSDAAKAVKSAILGLLRRFNLAFAEGTPENIRRFELTVLKNVALDAENVHIRFEDAATGLTGRHGPPFQYVLGFVVEKLGITDVLDAAALEAAAAEGAEAESAIVASKSMAKKMTWTGLAVYLCEDVMFQDAATFKSQEAMLDAFLEGVFSPPDAFPPLIGKCNGSCTVTVGPDESSPTGALDITAALSKLDMTIANQHFRCLSALQESFGFDIQACLAELQRGSSPQAFGAAAPEESASSPTDFGPEKDALAPLLDTHAFLCVTVCEAANLPPSFSSVVSEYSDAFVQLRLRRSSDSGTSEMLLQRTRVAAKSKQPLWLEAFPFEVGADLYRTGTPVPDSAAAVEGTTGEDGGSESGERAPPSDSEVAGKVMAKADGEEGEEMKSPNADDEDTGEVPAEAEAGEGGEDVESEEKAASNGEKDTGEVTTKEEVSDGGESEEKEPQVDGEEKSAQVPAEDDVESEENEASNGDGDADVEEVAPSGAPSTSNSSLLVEIYDHNLFADALIGFATVDLTELFAAKEALKGDERILELELSPPYAKVKGEGAPPTTVTVLLSYAPNKKEEPTRKHRPADTFSEPDESFVVLPESKQYTRDAPISRPVFEAEPPTTTDVPKAASLIIHDRISLATMVPSDNFPGKKLPESGSLFPWSNGYSSVSLDVSVGSMTLCAVVVPDGAAVDELAEDMSDTVVYRIDSPPYRNRARLKITKRGAEESILLALPPFDGFEPKKQSDPASEDVSASPPSPSPSPPPPPPKEETPFPEMPALSMPSFGLPDIMKDLEPTNASDSPPTPPPPPPPEESPFEDAPTLSIPSTELKFVRKDGDTLTLCIGEDEKCSRFEVRDIGALVAMLAGLIPTEPRLAVASGTTTPLLRAAIQAGLTALGRESLLKFGEAVSATASAIAQSAPEASMSTESDLVGDLAAILGAKERELQHLRRDLTKAKTLKRNKLGKRAEFVDRTVEEMKEENERLRGIVADNEEKIKEEKERRKKEEKVRQNLENMKTKLQESVEDYRKKLQFQKKWVKGHTDILKCMETFAKMKGGNTFAVAETPGISDKATKLYEARNNLLRERNAQLEVTLRERTTPEMEYYKEEAQLQAEEKAKMTQMHTDILEKLSDETTENEYLKADQKIIRSSIYKLDQRMKVLQSKYPDVYKDVMEAPADSDWPTEEEYFAAHEVETRKATNEAGEEE